MRLRRNRVYVAPIIAFAAALAGCNSSAKKTPLEAYVPVAAEVREVAADLAALRAAEDSVVYECLMEEGFRYFPKSAERHFQHMTELYSLHLGVISPSEAAARGYGNGSMTTSTGDEEVSYFNGMTELETDVYQAAFVGGSEEKYLVEYTTPSGQVTIIPVGGCRGEAAKEVYGSVDSYITALTIFDECQGMMAQLSDRTADDEDVKDAMREWSACMNTRGFSFASPVEARDAAFASRPTDPSEDTDVEPFTTGPKEPTLGLAEAPYLTKTERAIAVADAECQDEVNLSRTYTNVALREQTSVVHDRERLIASWKELSRQIMSTDSDLANERDGLLQGD